MSVTLIEDRQRGGPVGRFLHWIAAFDASTLDQCPPGDRDNATTIGILMILTWSYQAGLFALIGQRLLSSDQFSVEAIVAGMFIATFLLVIDSYSTMRASHHAAGVEALKAVGLDSLGGETSRRKATIFLGVRIAFSAGLAQLTAIMVALLIFHGDIDARLRADRLTANAHLLPMATAPVDAEIRHAAEAVQIEAAREQALADQIKALRQNQIDPATDDRAVRQSEQELADLIAASDRADGEARRVSSLASEQAGSSRMTRQRRAAMEGAQSARSQARAAAESVEAGRKRLVALRRQNALDEEEVRRKASSNLPEYERALAAEQGKLTEARDRLARLAGNREATITAAVEQAPDFVKESQGFLAQIMALEHIAESDSLIRAVIWIIDLTSFGLELAAVLAKTLANCPTVYSALITRAYYSRIADIAKGLPVELGVEQHGDADDLSLIDAAAGDIERREATSPGPDPLGILQEPVSPSPSKRGRGRPRKPRLH